MSPQMPRFAHLLVSFGHIVLLLSFCLPNAAAYSAETQSARQSDSRAILLLPSRIFDSETATIREGWSVLVTSNRITTAGPSARVTGPPGADRIELPDTTLLPGLMDLHSHIFLHPYNETLWDDQVLKEPVAYRTIEAVNHSRDTLLSGFTLLRDLGTEGAGFSDVAVKRAINEGLMTGPRLVVVTKAIVATASYGPGPRDYAENVLLPKGAQEATGAAELVKAVREQAGMGADWIKSMPITGADRMARIHQPLALKNCERWSKKRIRPSGLWLRTQPPPKECGAPFSPVWIPSSTVTAAQRKCFV